MSAYWRLVAALAYAGSLTWVWVLTGGGWALLVAGLIAASVFAVGQVGADE